MILKDYRQITVLEFDKYFRQYVQCHLDELYEPDEFNRGLMKYLIWYNTEKPHKGINGLPPLRYYLDTIGLEPYESKMLWDSTVKIS